MKITIKITKETTRQELLDLKKCIEALLEVPNTAPPKKARIDKKQIISDEAYMQRIISKGFLPISDAHKILKVPKSVTWLYWKIHKGEFSSKKVKSGNKQIIHVSVADIKNYFSKIDHK